MLRLLAQLKFQTSRKSVGKIYLKNNNNNNKHLLFSGRKERSQRKGCFSLSVIHAQSKDEVDNREHAHSWIGSKERNSNGL